MDAKAQQGRAPGNREIVRALLEPQLKGLAAERERIKGEIEKARAELEKTRAAESGLKDQARRSWQSLRNQAKTADILVTGLSPALLAGVAFLIAGSAARRSGAGPVTLVATASAAVLLPFVWANLMFVNRKGKQIWAGGMAALMAGATLTGLSLPGLLVLIAAGVFGAIFQAIRGGELSRIDADPREGVIKRGVEGDILKVQGAGSISLNGEDETFHGQRLVVATAGNSPIAWLAPAKGQGDVIPGGTWERVVLPRLIRSHTPVLVWTMRDRTAVSKAEAALQKEVHTRERLEKRIEALERQGEAWDGVGLPESTLRHLVTAASLISATDEAAPTGILLHGPAGTGKTEIGIRLARAGGMTFISTSASALKSEHVGGTEKAVAELFEKAKSEGPAIIFVDECDSCLPDRGGHADAFAKSITESFLTHWQGFDGTMGVCVVGATNHKGRVDPAIMSRFSDSLEIGPPDAPARATILAKAFKEAGMEETGDDLVHRTAGMVGRDLMMLARSLRREMLSRGEAQASAETVEDTLAQLRGRGSLKTDDKATWERLILPEAVLKDLKTMTRMMSSFEVLRSQGIRVPRGMLLEGPPGTGKTQVARTMANMSGLSFVPLSTADVKAGYVGQTAGLVRAAIERARGMAPSIVFMDEIDVLAPARGAGDAFTQDLIGQLLQELDGALKDERPIFFLGATNRPDMIDAAILSRFPRTLNIPLPDDRAREEILFVLLEDIRHIDGDRRSMAKTVAQATNGWSGRDLRSLVEQASIEAFNRSASADLVTLSLADIEQAASGM